MGISIWQILIVAVLVVLLFGRGRISDLMGDVAKGITSFKKGMKEDDSGHAASGGESSQDSKTIDAKAIDNSAASVGSAEKEKDKAN